MLTKADDFPIHQTPEPIAFAGTDRNFYDRYFFNGYTRDGEVFFAAALGVYPHLNIMDASFCVVHDGVQHNIHASRCLHMERLDTHVGPIAIEVVEPLKSLRVKVSENEHGISADLTFHRRAIALKEPRFTYRNGPRTVMDVTRLTQNGTWEGWVEIGGTRIEVSRDAFVGTRDRSWGVRPIGAADPQGLLPAAAPQFYWLWAPLNFDDRITLYHLNDDAHGDAWNTNAVMCGLADGQDEAQPEEMAKCRSEIEFVSGSRHARAARLFFTRRGGGDIRIDLTPKWQFYMLGLGYGHPEWGHGQNKGELAVGFERFKLSDIKSYAPPHLHIQAFVTAEMTLPDGETRSGAGILEQLVVGPHAPSGFKDILDPAK
ncbi:hypothetical protein [uncultured Parvibaculum sp.]|uniref:hypothetical protein n=1 Tax=uncultured Parvibaculum sp. TaxID=291828 RepID=UPI0030DA642D|tara:strand:+ start:27518 stop:28636 length:1119 start_codon:yes stop_codon:yes gene_type:complete